MWLFSPFPWHHKRSKKQVYKFKRCSCCCFDMDIRYKELDNTSTISWHNFFPFSDAATVKSAELIAVPNQMMVCTDNHKHFSSLGHNPKLE